MSGRETKAGVTVTVADDGMILIKQTDGIRDERPVVTVHPDDLAALIARLAEIEADAGETS